MFLCYPDIVKESLEYRDFHVWRPNRPGLGVALSEDKANHHRIAV